MENHPPKPDPALLEQYRQQMLDMYRRNTSEDNDWFDRRFPEPVPVFSRVEVEKDPPPSSSESATPPPIAQTPFIGYLRVFASAAEGAQPIPAAYVTVSRDGIIYANTVTDDAGYTQVIPLPSVDPALTLIPNGATPYLSYDIHVNAAGFREVNYNNVPVYGSNYVTQPVALHPLAYSDDPNSIQNFVSGGPENL